jgi:hypothetical protein
MPVGVAADVIHTTAAAAVHHVQHLLPHVSPRGGLFSKVAGQRTRESMEHNAASFIEG